MLEIDGQGQVGWEVFKYIGEYAYLRSICTTADGGFGIAGGVIPGGDPSLGYFMVVRFGPTSQTAEPPIITPASFFLAQNYPNPFNANTQITFTVARSAHVELTVFDMLGQRVATLMNDLLPAGSHSVTWDSGDFPSGLHMYQLKAGDFAESKKMILLK